MSRRSFRAVKGDPAVDHAAMDELLAWYVNGTLDAAGTRRVEGHLEVCETCRDRAEAERGFARMMRDAGQESLAGWLASLWLP